MSRDQELVIKTRAKMHEPSEPDRQKPIIRIDTANGRTMMSHISDSTELANTIRASIDSGRDNPFRPDGEIYKLTDPIVDYYKFGPNQSRTQTPTYAQLVGAADDRKPKTAGRLWRRRTQTAEEKKKQHQQTSRADGAPGGEQQQQQVAEARANRRGPSCWRKWICCRCFCRSSDEPPAKSANSNGHLEANIVDHYNTANAATRPTNSQDLTAGKLDARLEPTVRGGGSSRVGDSSQALDTYNELPSSALSPVSAMAPLGPPSGVGSVKQAKVVILEDNLSHDQLIVRINRLSGGNEVSHSSLLCNADGTKRFEAKPGKQTATSDERNQRCTVS